MSRTRKTAGRITFVGGGPGDPGLRPRRALEALATADQVVHARGASEPLLAPGRAEADAGAQLTASAGAPGEVARVLRAAARAGRNAVHLVAGDPFSRESVVKEVQAVARSSVRFEVVPGVGRAAGVATYAGVTLTGICTTVDVDDVS